MFWDSDGDGVLEEELLELHVLQVDHVLVVVLWRLMVPASARLQKSRSCTDVQTTQAQLCKMIAPGCVNQHVSDLSWLVGLTQIWIAHDSDL